MERNSWSSVFSADVMEFVTLSVKFCKSNMIMSVLKSQGCWEIKTIILILL